MKFVSTCLLVTFFLTGTGRAAERADPAFPIGLYGITAEDVSRLPGLHAAGFNTILASGASADMPALLKACEREGLRAVVSPGTSAGKGFSESVLAATTSKLGKSKVVTAWYLVDEPDFNKVSPAEVEKARLALAGLKTGIRSALVIGDGRAAAAYAGMSDVLMVDWYPVPHMPLASFGLAVRQARFAVGPRKAVWAVAQVFDWSEIYERANRLDMGGFPTRQELQAMSLLSVVEGASGLFYFSNRAGGKSGVLMDQPERWEKLASVAREMARLSPILSSPAVWAPVEVWIEKDQPRWRNVCGDAALQTSLRRLSKKQGDFPAGDYLLVVNTTRDHRSSKVRIPRLAGDSVIEQIQGRQTRLEKGWIGDDFEAYATRVYGPLPQASAPSHGK